MFEHNTTPDDCRAGTLTPPPRWKAGPGGRLLRLGLTLGLVGGGAVGLAGAEAVPAEAASSVIVDPDCNASGFCTQTFLTSGSIDLSDLDLAAGSEIRVGALGGRGGTSGGGTSASDVAYSHTSWKPTTGSGGLVWVLGERGENATRQYAGVGGTGGGPGGSGAGGNGGNGFVQNKLTEILRGAGGGGGGGSTWVYGFNGPDRTISRDSAIVVGPGTGGGASADGSEFCRTAAATSDGHGTGTCDGASGSEQYGGDGADFAEAPRMGGWVGPIDGGGGGGGGWHSGAGGGMDAAVYPPTKSESHTRADGGGSGYGLGLEASHTETDTARITLEWQRASNAVMSGGGLFHTRGVQGSWSQVGDVKSTAKFPSRARRVAMTSTDGAEIQTLISDNTGAMYHSIRRPDGQWTTAAAVNVGVEGLVVDVAATSSNGSAQFAAVAQDGRLWHTLRYPDGRWTRAGEPLAVTGDTGIGTVTSVAALDAGWGATQFFVTTSSNDVWMLTRKADGSWAKAAKVDLNGAAARQVAAFVSDGKTQVDVVTKDGALLHTLRHADGSWTAPGDAANAGRITGRVTHVAAVTTQPGRGEFLDSTSDGKLTRSIRYADGSWSSPDVLTTGSGLKQTVTAAAAVSLAAQQLDVIAIA